MRWKHLQPYKQIFDIVDFKLLTEVDMLSRPSDEDALKLAVAFYCIMEPEKRAQLLRLAEHFAMESAIVHGLTHLLLLDPHERSPPVQ